MLLDKKKKGGCHVGLELLVNASFLLRPTIHDRLLGLHDHDDVCAVIDTGVVTRLIF
jgi:hypothetical protein